MLSFDVDDNRFNFRSAAVVIQDEHVLLHKAISDDFWALPGGRVEFFETSEDTIARELKEELGITAEVSRQLWYVENFFNYKGKNVHEVSNYFLTKLEPSSKINSERNFKGIEEDMDLIFRWVLIRKLNEYVLKPSFLINGIKNLPSEVIYIKLNELCT